MIRRYWPLKADDHFIAVTSKTGLTVSVRQALLILNQTENSDEPSQLSSR